MVILVLLYEGWQPKNSRRQIEDNHEHDKEQNIQRPIL